MQFKTPAAVCLYAAIVAVASSPALGQSDPSNFTTVIDAPPTVIENATQLASDTQLNVATGAVVGNGLKAGVESGMSSNIEANITGGEVGRDFRAYAGSTVNISGGTVGGNFRSGSAGSTSGEAVVNISGGQVEPNFIAQSGSRVTVSGGTIEVTPHPPEVP